MSTDDQGFIDLPKGVSKDFFRTFLEFTLNTQNPQIQTHLLKGILSAAVEDFLCICDLLELFHLLLENETFFINHFL
jgi:hypothetical protein